MLMCLDRIICRSQFRVGMDFWYVHGLGASSFKTKYTVVGEPYLVDLGLSIENGSWYVPTSHILSNGKEYVEGCFLSDAGVYQFYNNNQCFFTEEAAQAYLENQLTLANNYRMVDIGFDYYPDYDYDDYYDDHRDCDCSYCTPYEDQYDDEVLDNVVADGQVVRSDETLYCEGCGRSFELCDCEEHGGLTH